MEPIVNRDPGDENDCLEGYRLDFDLARLHRIPEGQPAPEGFCEICGLPGGFHDEEECYK